MIEGRATARFARTSAQKAKLVLDLIRGHDVNRALATLKFTRRRAARDIEKVLRSAVSNAQQKEGASGDAERLYVGACYANQGPSLKRIRAAPMGRAFRITKRTSHLTVLVREREEPVVAVPAVAPTAPDTDAPSAAAEPRVAKTARRGSGSGRKRKTGPSKKGSPKGS
jgi:large subunit ribosomal protein L22